jgi:hypothetical protein
MGGGMTATTTPTAEQRIESLEAQVYDLAQLVGRLIGSLYGNRWSEYDPRIVPLLEWREEIIEEGDESPLTVGEWVYEGDDA